MSRLTTFPNPFDDEPEQGYLPSLLSKVKNTFAVEPVVEAPRKPSKPVPASPRLSKPVVPYTPLPSVRAAAAAPVVSITPVVSVSEEPRRRPSVSTIPDSPSSISLSAMANAELSQNFAIPGFPMADDARSTTGSLRRNGSVSKIIRRLRGEGLRWVDACRAYVVNTTGWPTRTAKSATTARVYVGCVSADARSLQLGGESIIVGSVVKSSAVDARPISSKATASGTKAWFECATSASRSWMSMMTTTAASRASRFQSSNRPTMRSRRLRPLSCSPGSMITSQKTLCASGTMLLGR